MKKIEMSRNEYHSELKKIGKRVGRFLSKINQQLYDINTDIRLCASAIMAGSLDYEEWPIDALRSLAEEYVSEAEALGIDIEGLDEILTVVYYMERKERKKKAKK